MLERTSAGIARGVKVFIGGRVLSAMLTGRAARVGASDWVAGTQALRKIISGKNARARGRCVPPIPSLRKAVRMTFMRPLPTITACLPF